MSKPSASSASVMLSGGIARMVSKTEVVKMSMPLSRQALLTLLASLAGTGLPPAFSSVKG